MLKPQKQPDTYKEQLSDDAQRDITLEMVFIPGGTFMMGSPADDPYGTEYEQPLHQVTVPPFFMGKYPVTQAQWQEVAQWSGERELNPNPSTLRAAWRGGQNPVECVTWEEAMEFCDLISRKTDRNYSLPSEAQWEYACRAGTTTYFHYGDVLTPNLANYDWTESFNGSPTQVLPSGGSTSVDEYRTANAFDLCGMHGNVWEYCLDAWHHNYVGAPTDGSAWMSSSKYPVYAGHHVTRGGSWDDEPWYCRSAARQSCCLECKANQIGFRVICHLTSSREIKT